jgi:hypothetical protein
VSVWGSGLASPTVLKSSLLVFDPDHLRGAFFHVGLS